MTNNGFLYRPQRGGLDASIREVRCFSSKDELARHLGVDPRSITAKPYAYDGRIDWDTYIVTVDNDAVGFTNGPIK